MENVFVCKNIVLSSLKLLICNMLRRPLSAGNEEKEESEEGGGERDGKGMGKL
jgi:hypothetical protein